MRRPHVGLVLCLGLLIAGCAEAGPPSNPKGFVPPASSAAATDATGSLAGVVVDEEFQPLHRATVMLAPGGSSSFTDTAGAFTFNDLEPGTYKITASRAGFVTANQATQVTAGEVSRIQVLLAALPEAVGVEPHIHSRQHRAYYNHAVADQTIATYTNNPLVSCQGCVWGFVTDVRPVNVLIEVFGVHTIPRALGNQEFVLLVDNRTPSYLQTQKTIPLPGKWLLETMFAERTDTYELTLRCESAWVCYQESRDVWVSWSHKMKIPDDFSAKPS